MPVESRDIPMVLRDAGNHFVAAGLGWTGRAPAITDRPGDGLHFVCLPVLDFVRLGFPDLGGRLDLLAPEDTASIAAGRAALMLDLANEGPGFQAHVFDALHHNLEARGIPRERVILVSQNRLLRADYERAYGPGLRFWIFDFFPLQVALWLDAEAGPRLFPDAPLDRAAYEPLRSVGSRRFLCQNAALRWHRVLLYRWFQLSGLDGAGLISFHGIGDDNPKAGGIDVFSAPPEVAGPFGHLLEGVGDWIPRRARRLDTAGATGDLVLTLDRPAYAASDLTVISETDFFEVGVERITEKSLKAAAMGLPFVMVGAQRAVALLSELGFHTFPGLIDHGYDTLADPAARLPRVFDAIAAGWRLCAAGDGAWRALAGEAARANVAHARCGLLRQIERTTLAPFADRMARFARTGALAP